MSTVLLRLLVATPSSPGPYPCPICCSKSLAGKPCHITAQLLEYSNSTGYRTRTIMFPGSWLDPSEVSSLPTPSSRSTGDPVLKGTSTYSTTATARTPWVTFTDSSVAFTRTGMRTLLGLQTPCGGAEYALQPTSPAEVMICTPTGSNT